MSTLYTLVFRPQPFLFHIITTHAHLLHNFIGFLLQFAYSHTIKSLPRSVASYYYEYHKKTMCVEVNIELPDHVTVPSHASQIHFCKKGRVWWTMYVSCVLLGMQLA